MKWGASGSRAGWESRLDSQAQFQGYQSSVPMQPGSSSESDFGVRERNKGTTTRRTSESTSLGCDLRE